MEKEKDKQMIPGGEGANEGKSGIVEIYWQLNWNMHKSSPRVYYYHQECTHGQSKQIIRGLMMCLPVSATDHAMTQQEAWAQRRRLVGGRVGCWPTCQPTLQVAQGPPPPLCTPGLSGNKVLAVWRGRNSF